MNKVIRLSNIRAVKSLYPVNDNPIALKNLILRRRRLGIINYEEASYLLNYYGLSVTKDELGELAKCL